MGAAEPYPASVLLEIFAPEFSDVPAQAKSDALALAALRCPAAMAASRRQEAMALYAAWLLGLRAASLSGSPAGPVRREREGDMEVEYAVPPATEAEAAGGYKARFDALLRPFGTGAAFVAG